VVEEHVLRAWIRRVNPRSVLAGMPAIHGGIELHARIAALVRRLRYLPHQVARLVPRHLFSGADRTGPPLAVLYYGLHELVASPHRVVRVLEEDRAVGVSIER